MRCLLLVSLLVLTPFCPPLFADPPQESKPVFKAGFAEKDITPDIGMEAPGGYGKAYHKTLHDPCKVRAAVFDDGRNRIAVVGIDALGIFRETVLKVRQQIEAKTGIPGDAVMIGASHSHSSGPLLGVMPHSYDHASKLVQRLAYDASTAVDPKYLAKCEEAIVAAVAEANEKRAVALAGVAKGREDQVAYNRRFKMRDGRTVTHPGLGNPEIVEPAGPVDPEVGVIGVWGGAKGDQVLGCVVNFACHATTSPGGISANYVHYLEKAIQGYYGKECVVVFINGMSGDVTQVDNRSPYQYPSGDKWAQIVGGRVGAEAVKQMISMHPGVLSPVAAKSQVLKIPHRAPDAERVKKSLEILSGDRTKVDPTEWTFAKEIVMLDAQLAKAKEAEVEMQVLQVGPVAMMGVPAEYFCQFGLELKAGSGFPFTFPVSLANGCVGYVPTEDAFGPNGGGYETRLTSYSNLEITAGTKMRDASLELVKQLKPGTVPEAPRRVPFTGKPWSYGNNPPEVK